MSANRKIVIIGAGHVGSHCANALAIQGICEEIVLLDIDEVKAESHAMDIADSVCFLGSSVIVRTGDYQDCKDADIIVISAGVPRLPGQTRLDTLGASLECMKEIVTHLEKIEIPGIIITISNPADIIADYIENIPNAIGQSQVTQQGNADGGSAPDQGEGQAPPPGGLHGFLLIHGKPS